MRSIRPILAVTAALAAALVTGCASVGPQADARAALADAFVYAPSTASALAFEPPMAIGQPTTGYSRDGRALAAFAGYEDQVTTFSYTHQRDEVRVYGNYGQLERHAYTDRTSVTTR